MTIKLVLAAALLTTSTANATVYMEDFSDGMADGASLFGNATVVSESVRLTENAGNQQGSMVIDLLDIGAAVESFTASFDLMINGATAGGNPIFPGDGSSFNFGALPDDVFGENGPGDGLTVSFDMFANAGGDMAPAVSIHVDGGVIADNLTSPFTGASFLPVTVNFDADGTLDVTLDGVALFTNLATGFVPEIGDRFGFGARTASATNEHRFDTIVINTTTAGGGGGGGDLVPEPASVGLLALGALALIRRGRAARVVR